MKNISQALHLEISISNFNFYVTENNEQDNLEIIYKANVPIDGFEDYRISDLEKVFNVIKENVFLIEQKVNHSFKEITLIIDNFNPSFINITGFKKLNGSQVLRENITYILNTLKSYVDKIETKKNILHIFNSKFYLDNKNIDNLPIGLFGDFYSHELAFTLINKNDNKNLSNIFDRCNLKIKKVLVRSFIDGAYLSRKNINTETFYIIKINSQNSKIIYFENNVLKFEQNFKFGTEIIIQDISKITSLKNDTVIKILKKIDFNKEILENELVENEFFSDDNYIKIKKKLIYEIALARIYEISELMLFKNINLEHFNKGQKLIFFEANSKSNLADFKEIFKKVFSVNNRDEVLISEKISAENLLKTVDKLVHFGWKKEAIPLTEIKKTLVARVFDSIFGQ
jgi:cell division protein FtsA